MEDNKNLPYYKIGFSFPLCCSSAFYFHEPINSYIFLEELSNDISYQGIKKT
jgi:uncharacterized membrane protein